MHHHFTELSIIPHQHQLTPNQQYLYNMKSNVGLELIFLLLFLSRGVYLWTIKTH